MRMEIMLYNIYIYIYIFDFQAMMKDMSWNIFEE